MTSHDDLTRWATLDEGQFFERKSAFERPGGQPKRRPVTTIAWDIAETLSAMANADGGVSLASKTTATSQASRTPLTGILDAASTSCDGKGPSESTALS